MSILRYFYFLYFQREVGKDQDNKPVTSTIDLGYYSTRTKALEKINKYKDLVGFKDHPIECFDIWKLGVHFEHEIINKSGLIIYELFHEWTDEELYDYPDYIGCFSTEEEAKAKMEKLLKYGKYKKHPEGFEISSRIVDKDYVGWEEGFNSWDD